MTDRRRDCHSPVMSYAGGNGQHGTAGPRQSYVSFIAVRPDAAERTMQDDAI